MPIARTRSTSPGRGPKATRFRTWVMARSLVSVPASASVTISASAIGRATRRFIAGLDELIGMIVGRTAIESRRPMTIRVSLLGLLIVIAQSTSNLPAGLLIRHGQLIDSAGAPAGQRDCRLQISDFRLRLQISDRRFQIEIADCKFQVEISD